MAEMGLKKDLALPLEVISSGIKPTIFDIQIKRRTKIVERICVALSRVHESSVSNSNFTRDSSISEREPFVQTEHQAEDY